MGTVVQSPPQLAWQTDLIAGNPTSQSMTPTRTYHWWVQNNEQSTNVEEAQCKLRNSHTRGGSAKGIFRPIGVTAAGEPWR
jgi:hypothetical protein